MPDGRGRYPGRTRKIVKWFSPVAALFVVFGILFASIDSLGFDQSFYVSEYQKLGTAADIGMSKQDLSAATTTLLDYLRAKRDDLTVYAEIAGKMREVFNQKEKLHMSDVRALYQRGRTIAYGMLAAGTLFYAGVFFYKAFRREALKGYVRGNLIFLATLAMAGLYAALDFNTFWTTFHKILFTNDLWLLNPKTDILIMMVPEQFFFDLVMHIALFSFGMIGILLLGTVWWGKRLKSGRETA